MNRQLGQSIFLTVGAATAAIAMFASATPGVTAASRPSVTSALLDCDGDQWRTRLVLWTHKADADRGDKVVAYQQLVDLTELVHADERRHGRWLITPAQPHAMKLLRDLRHELAESGEARFKAGVAAASETGGRLSYFSIKGCDRRTPPRSLNAKAV